MKVKVRWNAGHTSGDIADELENVLNLRDIEYGKKPVDKRGVVGFAKIVGRIQLARDKEQKRDNAHRR